MKLLIVDDETRTRELLRNYIPWGDIGIDDVDTARNGQVALELALEWKPDIILCDVRMPKLNGIDFARQYRETDPQCQILFLSGFSDKDYLKSAIHLKAFTYLEKPVNLNEVRAAVEAAVILRQVDIKKREEEQQYQAGVDRSLPILRQEMVRKLVCNPSSAHVEPALRSQETFLISREGPYTVTAANLYWDPSDLPEDPASTQEGILDRINRHPRIAELRILAGFDSHNQLVLVLSGEYRSSYREGRETIEEVDAIIRELAGAAIDLRLGIGEPVKSIVDIPASYKLASLASALQYYANGGRPVFADALGRHEPILMDWEEVRKLREQLRAGHLDEAKGIIRKWTAYARTRLDLNILRLKDTYFQFLLAIMETAVHIGMADQAEDTERRYMWKEIDRIPSLDALEQYVFAMLDACAEQTENSDGAGSGKMREIVRYIHSHFHEKGFTIRSIADHVQLSETYLCAYFKKQRGQTIKEFITDTRMNRAKELLRDMNVKLFEVAVRLGFADANYFTTFFKRNAGLTPSEYRERTVR
ncbi:response regulator [Cohnella yongneupensis]|uniref:Response regulator n=1 Tax=Cohnella yongneupensis TaxID=425006 RepID=A0ABW0R1P3_9BACL